jgi:hypothetical protein
MMCSFLCAQRLIQRDSWAIAQISLDKNDTYVPLRRDPLKLADHSGGNAPTPMAQRYSKIINVDLPPILLELV